MWLPVPCCTPSANPQEKKHSDDDEPKEKPHGRHNRRLAPAHGVFSVCDLCVCFFCCRRDFFFREKPRTTKEHHTRTRRTVTYHHIVPAGAPSQYGEKTLQLRVCCRALFGSDETWLSRNRYLIVAAFQGNFNPKKEVKNTHNAVLRRKNTKLQRDHQLHTCTLLPCLHAEGAHAHN